MCCKRMLFSIIFWSRSFSNFPFFFSNFPFFFCISNVIYGEFETCRNACVPGLGPRRRPSTSIQTRRFGQSRTLARYMALFFTVEMHLFPFSSFPSHYFPPSFYIPLLCAPIKPTPAYTLSNLGGGGSMICILGLFVRRYRP